MKKSSVTKISNFGLLTRRWQNNDHIVVVGHNEATQSFFMFNQRQLRESANKMYWGTFGTHDPVKRVERILDAADNSWSYTSECWYHGTLSIERPIVVHHHIIGLRSFKVSDAVMKNQVDPRLGYYEFPRDDVSRLGHSKTLQSVISEVLDIISLQRAA